MTHEAWGRGGRVRDRSPGAIVGGVAAAHAAPTMAALSAELLFVAVTFLLAGTVKGVLGLGMPTVAIGLLSLLLPPAEAAAILVAPSLITNAWQGLTGGALRPLVRRLWPVLVAIPLGALAGTGLLTGSGAATAVTWLGLALMLYAATGLIQRPWQVPARIEIFLGPPVGLATGFVTAATGVFVLPVVPFLQALGLTKDELVQALGLSFTVSTLALAGLLGQGGALTPDVAMPAAIGTATAIAGMVAGQWLRRRVATATFRRWFFLSLLLLGLHLALRAML